MMSKMLERGDYSIYPDIGTVLVLIPVGQEKSCDHHRVCMYQIVFFQSRDTPSLFLDR